jgi:hypothetical protein
MKYTLMIRQGINSGHTRNVFNDPKLAIQAYTKALQNNPMEIRLVDDDTPQHAYDSKLGWYEFFIHTIVA